MKIQHYIYKECCINYQHPLYRYPHEKQFELILTSILYYINLLRHYIYIENDVMVASVTINHDPHVQYKVPNGSYFA